MEKVPLVLYPSLQSPCVLCDQWLLYRSHFNSSLLCNSVEMVGGGGLVVLRGQQWRESLILWPREMVTWEEWLAMASSQKRGAGSKHREPNNEWCCRVQENVGLCKGLVSVSRMLNMEHTAQVTWLNVILCSVLKNIKFWLHLQSWAWLCSYFSAILFYCLAGQLISDHWITNH